jgi:hypothetical protein
MCVIVIILVFNLSIVKESRCFTISCKDNGKSDYVKHNDRL